MICDQLNDQDQMFKGCMVLRSALLIEELVVLGENVVT